MCKYHGTVILIVQESGLPRDTAVLCTKFSSTKFSTKFSTGSTAVVVARNLVLNLACTCSTTTSRSTQ